MDRSELGLGSPGLGPGPLPPHCPSRLSHPHRGLLAHLLPRGVAQPLPERPHCAQMWPHIARQLPQPQHQDHTAGAFGEPPALPQLSRVPVSGWVSPSCHLTSRISRRDKNPTPPSLRSFRSEVRPWLLHPGPGPLWSPNSSLVTIVPPAAPPQGSGWGPGDRGVRWVAHSYPLGAYFLCGQHGTHTCTVNEGVFTQL